MRERRTTPNSRVRRRFRAGDRLASWTGGSYTYDAAGCVTHIARDGRPALDLTWNGQYQLVSVSTNGEFAESYAYDALGRRVSTTTLEGTVRHVYDDNWQCIADIDENGNVLCSYVWGEGIDKLLAVKIGGNVYYPLTDIQGTVWGYVDSQNNVVARWTYDAWGNVLSEFCIIPALASVRYRFQGRERSQATGLTNFRMRWYDTETGRWLSKDPIGLIGGLNLYVFCGNRGFENDYYGFYSYGVYPSIIGPVVPPPSLKGNGPYWHHGGRNARNRNLPSKPPTDGKDGWEELPASMSIYHDNGRGKPERKFINVDGREAVYDGDTGKLVNDNDHKGTFNYVNPRTKNESAWAWIWRGPGHFFADMLPFYIFGN